MVFNAFSLLNMFKSKYKYFSINNNLYVVELFTKYLTDISHHENYV